MQTPRETRDVFRVTLLVICHVKERWTLALILWFASFLLSAFKSYAVPVVLNTNLQMRLILNTAITGGTGTTYFVETSTNLVLWAPLASLPETNNPVRFWDFATGGLSSRFYRVRSQ